MERKLNVNARRSIQVLISAILLIGRPSGAISEESATPIIDQTHGTFSNLRADLLARIGGASKQILIATNFLTDADIVSSLYIAQYRKVQISVLLGRDRASHILSRLGYLKQVNIPVALRPVSFYSEWPTIMMLDDKLFSINSELDYLSKSKTFVIKPIDGSLNPAFEKAFQEAALNKDTPTVKPLPLVGGQYKGGKGRRLHQPSAQSPDPSSEQASNPIQMPSKDAEIGGTTGADGVYRYRRVKDRPGAGVPTKLPKMTLREELERQRAAARARQAPQAAQSP